MSLDDFLWIRLHFQNVIIKCLSIESVEYCYVIPIISQLADYWGDRKIACLCKILSRQVKQHLNHAIHIHLLLSPPSLALEGKGSLKGEQLKDFLRDYRYADGDATFRTPYGTSGSVDAGGPTKEYHRQAAKPPSGRICDSGFYCLIVGSPDIFSKAPMAPFVDR